MSEAIHVSPRVVVPAAALQMRAVRSSGPGGQNVNKVASKVELLVNMELIEGLGDGARRRLLVLARNRRDAQGRLRVTSQRSRDQHRNREDCRRRVRDLVARALRPPTPRRPTRPTAGARERRLQSKRQLAERKRARGRVRRDET